MTRDIAAAYELKDEERLDRVALVHFSNKFVKEHYGQFVSVKPSTMEEEHKGRFFINGIIEIPYLIDDAPGDERHLRFERFDDILSLSVSITGRKVYVEGSGPGDILSLVVKKRLEKARNLEHLLLEVAKDKFSQIPAVRTAHAPLIGIIESMDDIVRGRVDLEQKAYLKWKKYIPLLKSLRVIEENGGKLDYGEEFKELEGVVGRKENSTNLTEMVFSYVLRNGRDYLADYLNLTATTPYLRTSYLYYNQAISIRRLMTLSIGNIREEFKRLYSRSYNLTRIRPWVYELSKTKVIQMVGENIKGNEEIFSNLMRSNVSV